MKIFLTALALSLAAAPVFAEPATVVHVVDGDTVDVNLAGRVTRVRLPGIDAPEIYPRARCDRERQLGEQAKAKAAELLPIGAAVDVIHAPDRDPRQRLLARITIRGTDFEREMMRRGLARPYNGRGPKPDWCG